MTAAPVRAAEGPCSKGLERSDKDIGPGLVLVEESCAEPLYRAFVVKIDLTRTRYRFQVTPYKQRRQTTSKFASKVGAVVAVNGGFWCDEWGGFTVADGELWPEHSVDTDTAPVVGFGGVGASGALRVEIRDPAEMLTTVPGWMTQAITGNPLVLDNGTVVEHEVEHTLFKHKHPRTGLGLDDKGETLILVVVDGRQPGYSTGLRITQLARLLASHGAVRGTNLDGGSSSTLVIPVMGGLVNDPSYKKADERRVPNHLAIIDTKAPEIAAAAWLQGKITALF